MKIYLIVALSFIGVTAVSAQDLKSPLFQVDGELISATYYHENGEVSQKGTFNKDGALVGFWTSYDNNGNKLSQGYYENGTKSGKWFFWSEDTFKEVDFQDSKITNVIEWDGKSEIALK